MKFEEFDLSKNADGLLPVVVQDATTLKVLMVAYMNREAYEKTVETGKATFTWLALDKRRDKRQLH